MRDRLLILSTVLIVFGLGLTTELIVSRVHANADRIHRLAEINSAIQTERRRQDARQDSVLRTILCLARTAVVNDKSITKKSREKAIAFYTRALKSVHLAPCSKGVIAGAKAVPSSTVTFNSLGIVRIVRVIVPKTHTVIRYRVRFVVHTKTIEVTRTVTNHHRSKTRTYTITRSGPTETVMQTRTETQYVEVPVTVTVPQQTTTEDHSCWKNPHHCH